ncbi:AMP-binding protein [Fulvivirga ulvae]|uniref:AMP-binding protein n=1 Tax=Fulvivirga ulvae TaxID=2904245 RepID=UPI001F222F4C|nr:AMP-binding protein [Fulvivirga ulvae]UII30516.1 AMP-binding protein [Fulvivirga ulvae]
MDPAFQINGKTVAWEKLDQFDPSNPFEKTTIDFVRQWLSGTSTFNIHTSGSTGTPKAISITRKQMETSARFTINALQLQPFQTALVCLDTGYIAGKMMLVRALINRMNIMAVNPSSNPLENISYSPDFAAVVPLQLEEMLKYEQVTNHLNKMSAIIVGGAPISTMLERKLQQITAPVYATYGMTETVSHIALKRLNGPEKSATYTTFEEVKLGLDPRGCLTIQSALTNHEVLITNDLVNLADNHHFEWLGRADNTINSGGVKIQSEKVEKVVSQILDELELPNRFFVAGLPDEKLGQKVCLIIEAESVQSDLKNIAVRLQEKLDKYETPKSILSIPHFSETPTGKINRKKTLKNLTITNKTQVI